MIRPRTLRRVRHRRQRLHPALSPQHGTSESLPQQSTGARTDARTGLSLETAVGLSSSQRWLWITWTASTDNAPGIEYEVRVNGTIIDVIPGGTQTVSYTEVLGANTVAIVAVDQAGYASAPSNPITVLTNWGPGGCGF